MDLARLQCRKAIADVIFLFTGRRPAQIQATMHLFVYSVYKVVGELKLEKGFQFISYTETSPTQRAHLFHGKDQTKHSRVAAVTLNSAGGGDDFLWEKWSINTIYFSTNPIIPIFWRSGRFSNGHSNHSAIDVLHNNGNLCCHQLTWVLHEISINILAGRHYWTLLQCVSRPGIVQYCTKIKMLLILSSASWAKGNIDRFLS